MRKLIAFFVVAAVVVTANQAFAQCATCAGSAPMFSQPVNMGTPQVFGAPVQSYGTPVQSYAAPVQSYAAPVQSYAAPVQSYAAPVQYGTPVQSYAAPVQYGTPVASTGCSGCCDGCGSMGGTVVSGDVNGGMVNGGMVSGGMVSGELNPYSTQGLPAGAVVVSDVVSGEGSEGGTVEGTVESTSVMGASDTVEPPAPVEDSAVDKLPAEGEKTGDGT